MAGQYCIEGDDEWGGYIVFQDQEGALRVKPRNEDLYAEAVARDAENKVYAEIERVTREHDYTPEVTRAVVCQRRMAGQYCFEGDDEWGGYIVFQDPEGAIRVEPRNEALYAEAVARDAENKVYAEIERVTREHDYPPEVTRAVVCQRLSYELAVIQTALEMLSFEGWYDMILAKVEADRTVNQGALQGMPGGIHSAANAAPMPVIGIESDPEEEDDPEE